MEIKKEMENQNSEKIIENIGYQRYPGQFDPLSDAPHTDDVYIPVVRKQNSDDKLEQFGLIYKEEESYITDDDVVYKVLNPNVQQNIPIQQNKSLDKIVEIPIKKEIPKNKVNHVQVVQNDTQIDTNTDLVVIVSDKPVQITLPFFDDNDVHSISNHYSSKSIQIKNLTLSNHFIKTQHTNTFDNIPNRNVLNLGAGSKKQVSSVGNTWVVF